MSLQGQYQHLPLSPSGGSTRWALSQFTTFHLPLEEAVPQYAKAGFSGIGLWRPRLADFGEERAADLLAEHRLDVSSLSFVGSFTGSHGLGYQEAIDDAHEALAQARTVKAQCLIVIPGGLNGHILKHARRNIRDGLAGLADEAAAANVRLAIRPMRPDFHHSWSVMNTIEETLQLIDGINHPAVGLSLDLYHCSHDTSWLVKLPEVVQRLAIVQLNDAPTLQATEYEMCLPGAGVLPVHDMLTQLAGLGYRGYCEVNVWSEALWREATSRVMNDLTELRARLGQLA